MTLGHFLYIPGVFLLGVLIGYILGGRAAASSAADRDLTARRAAARKARSESTHEPPRAAGPGDPSA